MENVLNGLNIKKRIKNELIKIIKIRIPPKLIKIRSIIILLSLSFNGIDDIKESLIKGKNLGKQNIPIPISYKILDSPRYECILYTYNITDGMILLKRSLNEIKKTIKNKGGYFLLEKEPAILGMKKNKFWI